MSVPTIPKVDQPQAVPTPPKAMGGLDYWRLCEEVSIVQAALLIAGCDPSDHEFVENLTLDKQPLGYDAAKTAIMNVVRRGTMGRRTPLYDRDGGEIGDSVDPKESTIEVEALKLWLAGRGFKSGFFFPQASTDPDYLDPRNRFYAPKLAAAVSAWLAVTCNGDVTTKSPKHYLQKWLREHAADFRLTDKNGNPNETAIEEAAKIANWQPIGGAPRTSRR